MPIDRWLRGLALFGVLLCFGVVVLGAYVRLTDAGLGCPDWPGCYGHVSPLGAEDSPAQPGAVPGQAPAGRQGVARDDSPLCRGHARLRHHRDRGACDRRPQTQGRGRGIRAAALRHGDRTGHPRHADRDVAVETPHRDAASHLRHDHTRPAVVAVAAIATASRAERCSCRSCRSTEPRRGPTLRRRRESHTGSRSSASSCSRSNSSSVAGPAPTMPPLRAPTFRHARAPGGRTPTSAMLSCCGADSGSIMRVAF